MKKTSRVRSQRDQCFCALLSLLVFVGILEPPTMDVANFIWKQTLKVGSKMGLHETPNTRHTERIEMMCIPDIFLDAINRCFDSVLSPFAADREWHHYHILQFEKHLFADTEKASISLGMLQHQYELPMIVFLENLFKKHLLTSHISVNNVGKACHFSKDIDNEMKDYYVFKTDLSNSNLGMDVARGNGTAVDFLLSRLTDFVIGITPGEKPSREGVQYALLSMTKLMVEVPDRENIGQMRMIPSLGFAPDGSNWTMIAVKMIQNVQKDRTKAALRQVLSHPYTHARTVLYGQMQPEHPYIFQSLNIRRNEHAPKLQMENPDFHSLAARRFVQASLRGVHASSRRGVQPGYMTKEDSQPERFDSYFSSTTHLEVDFDLDDYAAAKHASKIGLRYAEPTEDCDETCNVSSLYFNARCAQKLTLNWIKEHGPDVPEPQLLEHPRCFVEMQDAVWRRDQMQHKASHPAAYSLKRHVSQLYITGNDDDKENGQPPSESVPMEEDDREYEDDGYGAAAPAAASSSAPRKRSRQNNAADMRVFKQFTRSKEDELQVQRDMCDDDDDADEEDLNRMVIVAGGSLIDGDIDDDGLRAATDAAQQLPSAGGAAPSSSSSVAVPAKLTGFCMPLTERRNVF
jgi:hypothetical protein